MKTPRIFVGVIFLAGALFLFPNLAHGRQGKPDSADGDKKTEKMIADAKLAFVSLGKQVSDKNWEAVQELMTKEAAETFCNHTLLSLGMLNMDPPFEMPGLDDAKERLSEVSEKYDLLDLEELADPRNGPGNQDAFEEAAAKLLDKEGKRWEIVEAILVAQEGSPMSVDLFGGEIAAATVVEDAVELEINPAMPDLGDMGGPPMGGQQMELTIFVRLENTVKGWKYAGVDDKKTREAMEEMMPDGPMGGPGGGPGGGRSSTIGF